ncbi:MAG: DUF1800 domain-containing protein, partial [Planctomycetota bacterium]|nr:DUF1800 domain-containing protein [Planctomycetota bacterium]
SEAVGARQEASPRAIGRRGLFAGLAGALAAVAKAAALPPPAVSALGDADPSSLITKLVRRSTFGPNRAELALARAIGYEAYLDFQLNPDLIDDAACDARLATLTTLTQIYAEIYQNPMSQVINELTEASIIRAVYSKRQLFERVVEFWTDHFNIDVNKENCAWLKVIDDRDVVRANALGRFSDMLAASAFSPAMLVYLDNHISIAGNPNLNYARELMELHSLGVNGGYTEADVVDVARCFTGWQVYPNTFGFPLAGIYRYNGSQHDNGEKRVLGHTIAPGGGIQDGLTVLQILADHPSTASFISRKLCKRFLNYTPSESLIRTVTNVYTSTGGDISRVLRTILAAPHLAEAPPKFKRPFHAFVSAVRATGSQVNSTSSFRTQLKIAGHLTFNWTSPDGYPDSLDFWGGLVLPRWNFGAQMMNSNLSGIVPNAASFFTGASTPAELIARIENDMFGGELEPADRQAILGYLATNPSSATVRAEALGLAVGSPSFQWY